MLKPAFIDISHWNTIPQSLVPARQSGILGVIHKCTEGTSYVDDKCASRRFLAQQAYMLWGLYHFVQPGDMYRQVDHFLRNAEKVSDNDTLLCLDWEVSDVSLDDAVEFLRRVEQISGRSPVVYSGHVIKEAMHGQPDPRINKYRLWLAQYTAGVPTLPPGWTKFWGWQYTEQGSVPGVSPPVDLNAYDGTGDELATDWSVLSGAVIPEPQPEPEPEVPVVTIMVPAGVEVQVIRTGDTNAPTVGSTTQGHARRRSR